MVLQDIYSSDFLKETQEIKEFLNQLKNKSDQFDAKNPDISEQITFIQEQQKSIFPVLDKHFFNIWSIAEEFSEEELQRHRRFYQQELVPLFEVSPYNKRVYDKPLGYAGDYVLMLYLYEDGYEGDSTYAKFIHRYSMHVPAARANHNRKDFYKAQINNILEKNAEAQITSIACGPAIEILEALKENPLTKQAAFTCLDFEERALRHVRNEVAALEKEQGEKFNINFIHGNVQNLLRFEKLDVLFPEQDLIYSSGLIDYFSDRIAAKMIEVLFKKLKPGGKLIVGNVSADNRHRAYTELLGEWFINHRTEKDMLTLTERIKENKIIEIACEAETKMNIFLIITKP